MVETRSTMWQGGQVQKEGTNAMTSELINLLTLIADSAPQVDLKVSLRNKITSYLSSDIEKWTLNESDIILSIINGSQFKSL